MAPGTIWTHPLDIRSKDTMVNTGALLVPTRDETGPLFLKAAVLEFSTKDNPTQNVHAGRSRD